MLGEVLPYEFDDEDKTTVMTLVQINGLQVEDALRQKVVKCKLQDRSQAHPKWGPFKLSSADSPLGHIAVTNAKGKRAHSFLKKEFLISHPTLSFALEDSVTYTLLCYSGPLMIATQIEAAKRSKVISREEFGPFRLSRNTENPRLICISKGSNVLYCFNLSSTNRPAHEGTAPLGQQASAT
jgi:hypothetical protein